MARKKLSEEVADALTKDILDGKYSVGEYLPSEELLCKMFDVSRTTVREGVSTLVEKGFVERQHGKGAMVIDHSENAVTDSFKNMVLRGGYTVEEFFETRLMIEMEIALLAKKKATPEDLETIRAALYDMKNAGDDMEKYMDADVAFHSSIAKASKNRLLEAIYNAIVPMVRQMVRHDVKHYGMVEMKYEEHTRIYESIQSGDDIAVEEAVSYHNRMSQQMYEDSIRRNETMEQILKDS